MHTRRSHWKERQLFLQGMYLKNIRMTCRNFFDVGTSEKYKLETFTFEDIDVQDERQAFNPSLIPQTTAKNVKINGEVKF